MSNWSSMSNNQEESFDDYAPPEIQSMVPQYCDNLTRIVASRLNTSWNRWCNITTEKVNKKDIERLAREGHLSLMKWLIEHGCEWTSATYASVARVGDLPTLQWLLDSSRMTDSRIKSIPKWNEDACGIAAKLGHRRILELLLGTHSYYNFEWSTHEIRDDDHQEVLQWITVTGQHLRLLSAALAARYGHSHILEWMSDQEFYFNISTVIAAIENGDIFLLHLLHALDCCWNETACSVAVQLGNLEALQYLRENGCPWSTNITTIALEARQMKILKWCIDNGAEWEEGILIPIIQVGNVELLEWCILHNCPLPFDITSLAARYNQLEVIKWAIGNECMWSDNTCLIAAGEGYIDILIWCSENGCDYDVESCYLLYRQPEKDHMSHTYDHNSVRMIEWCIQNGYESTSLCNYAAEYGDLDALQCLRAVGCPWNEKVLILALKYKHCEVFKWALENGCPHQLHTIRRYPLADEWLKTVKYPRQYR